MRIEKSYRSAAVGLLLMLAGASAFAQAEGGAGAELTKRQADGKQLFASTCAYCHAAGPARAGTFMLERRLGKERALLEARNDLDPAYIKAIVRGGLNSMLPYRKTEISDKELEAIVDYLTRNTPAKAAANK